MTDSGEEEIKWDYNGWRSGGEHQYMGEMERTRRQYERRRQREWRIFIMHVQQRKMSYPPKLTPPKKIKIKSTMNTFTPFPSIWFKIAWEYFT